MYTKTNIYGEQVRITRQQAALLRSINFAGKYTVYREDKRQFNICRKLADKGLIQIDWAYGNAIRYKRV